MMLLYECKKIVQNKLFLCSLVCSLLVIIVLFCNTLQKNGFYTEKGAYETGIQAAQKLTRQRSLLPGTMNDELLKEVSIQYRSLLAEKRNLNQYGEFKNDVYGSSWQKYRSLGDLLQLSFKLDDRKVPTVQELSLQHNKQLDKLIIKKGNEGNMLYTVQQQKRIQQLANRIKTDQTNPYEDAKTWDILLEDTSFINVIICVLAVVMSFSIFSKEQEIGTASILFTTRYGRTKNIMMKITIVLLLNSAIFIILHGLYYFLIQYAYSSSGWNVIVQYQPQYWLSVFPFTNLQAYLFVLFLGYCASMTCTAVTLLFSRVTKKVYYSLILSLLFLFLPAVVTHSIPMFPWDMTKGSRQFMSLPIMSLFDKAIFDYELQAMTTLVSVLSLLFVYHSFKRPSVFND